MEEVCEQGVVQTFIRNWIIRWHEEKAIVVEASYQREEHPTIWGWFDN
jgi:hypothetical protein